MTTYEPSAWGARYHALTAVEACGVGTGVGKTTVLLMDPLAQRDAPTGRALFLRRAFPQLLDAIAYSKRAFPEYGARWNAATHVWTFPSGFCYQFGWVPGEQDHLTYDGPWTYIGFDEVQQIPEEAYLFLRTRLRTREPALYGKLKLRAMAGMGWRETWVVRRFFEPLAGTLADNPDREFARQYGEILAHHGLR